MNKALQDYFDEFITAPDYDLMNPLSQQQFYQEGGFARFFPVNPGGYQAMQLGNLSQMPQDQSHQLWANASSSFMNLGQLGLQKQNLNLNRDRFAYQKTQDVVDNKYKELQYQLGVQQLDQRKAEFGFEKSIKEMQMINTMSDKFSGANILPQDMEDDPVTGKMGYGSLLAKYKIPEAMASKDPQQMANAWAMIASDPRYAEINSNTLRRDKNVELITKITTLDPDLLLFSNATDVIQGISNGKVGDEFKVTDETGYKEYKTLKTQAQVEKLKSEKAKNEAAAAEDIAQTAMITDLNAAGDALVKEIEASDLTPLQKAEKIAEARRNTNSKIAAAKTQKETVPNKNIDLWMFYKEGLITREEYMEEFNKRVVLENSSTQTHKGALDENGNLVQTNQLGDQILKSQGNAYFKNSPFNSTARGMLEMGVNYNIGNFTFKSLYPESNTPVLDASKGNAFIPAGGHYNQDGSYTVTGNLYTNDKSLKKKLNKEAPVVKSTGEIAGYSAFDTDEEIYKISTSFTVNPTELGLPEKPWATKATAPNPNSSSSVGNKANVEYITPRANGFLDKIPGGSESLTGAKHHLEKGETKTDTIDIGLGANKHADANFKFFNSPAGRETMVDEGYMALHEVPKGQKFKYTIDYNSNPLIKPFQNPSKESSGEHLHVMPVDGRITTLAGDPTPYKISFAKTLNELGKEAPSYILESENNRYTITKQSTGEYAVFDKNGWYLRPMSAEGMAKMLGKSQKS